MPIEPDPHSEPIGESIPAEYHAEHPSEQPSDWGWHGEWGRSARVAGWFVVILLLVLTTATHYNLQGALFLGLFAIALAAVLIWDRQRRRTSWRK